ncbi:MAG: NAD-dependent dehydratase [Gammaproteobacteria bacterium]|nr:MAG: NAD-dependent dehydratase [Gammaproteobacteria bacterium]
MSSPELCILGGTGFIGRHLAARLNRLGRPHRVLSRRPEAPEALRVLPRTEHRRCDVYDEAALRAAFAGCRTVINLVGILHDRDPHGRGFRRAHLELARTVLAAAQDTGVRHLVHMSALNADADRGPSHYLRSKGEAEVYLLTFHGDVALTLLRPSVVFGPGDGFFCRFARLLRLAPGVFLLPGAHARLAPVYVGDLVERTIEAIDRPPAQPRRLALCGPRDGTLLEWVRYTAAVLALRRWILPLPDTLAWPLAAIAQQLPGPPLSLDNLRSLRVPAVCGDAPRQPTAVEDVVPAYLRAGAP